MYFGWVIVGVITLSGVASAVQLNPTIGVFVVPITEEFDWDRSVVAGAVTIGTILGGLTALGVGPLIDRLGGRWVLGGGFLAMGALLIALGASNTLWQFYLIVITTRLILQGIINLTNNIVVSKWFLVQRGRALAISSLGQRVGIGVIPFVAQAFISGFGWRMAIGGLGVLAWGLTLVPVFGWLRRRPEDMRLAPDGVPLNSAGGQAREQLQSVAVVPTEVSFTLREALRTRTFYILLVSLCVTNFVATGVNFNLLPMLTDRGITATQGVTIISVWSLVGIPTTLAAGLLGEKVALRHLMALLFAGMAVGIAILSGVDSLWQGFLFAVVHGAFFGALMLLQNLIFANYYGRASLGAIRGFVTPFQMFSNSLGPLGAALVFDTSGSYTIIFLVYVGMLVLLALSMLFATPPVGEHVPSAEDASRR